MLHEIQPKVFENSFRAEAPDADSFIIHIKDNAILIKETDDGIAFPRFGESGQKDSALTYLFAIDDIRFFLSEGAEPEGDFKYHDLMEFRYKNPKFLSFAASAACQLWGWYSNNRFCGRCGSGLVHDKNERMMRCDNCGNTVYPKIAPVVIAGVTDGNRLLMIKYSGRTYKRFALIAGFAEIGEPIEDTVKREVLEEVGLRVKNIRYYGSQPWPFSGSLLLGLFCDLDGPDKIVLDENELEDAEWVRREDIDLEPDDISLTNEMIIYFKEH
jgi:NAD+ diphosphatase